MGPAVVVEEMRTEYVSQMGDLQKTDNDRYMCADGKMTLKPCYSVKVATELYETQWRNSANTFTGDSAKFTKAGTVITSAATVNCPRFIPHNEVCEKLLYLFT